jgi:hypothetical protein
MKTQQRNPGRPYRKNRLQMEWLESRRLLSGLVEGVDDDGDAYEIRLSGPGSIANPDIDYITLASTSSGSYFTVSVTAVGEHGDGLVNIGRIYAGENNLGKVTIEGDLGGLVAGRVQQITARSLGAVEADSHIFTLGGSIKSITAPDGISDATFTIAGNVSKLQVGTKQDTETAGNISNSTFAIDGDLDRLLLNQSMTDESIIDVTGRIKQVRIRESMVNSTIQVGGDLSRLQVEGSIYSMANNGEEGAVTVSVGGDVAKVQVKKSINNAIMNITGDLKRLRTGEDFQGTTLRAENLNKCQIGDDLNNSQIGITERIDKLQARQVSGLTLRVSETLGRFFVKEDVSASTISVFNRIDMIKIGGDLNRSNIIGGVDIGEDFTHNTVDDTDTGEIWIDKIMIRKDMSDSSISAGIKANGNFFGDGDDTRTGDDGRGTARIHKVLVRGEISSSGVMGESYAIIAEDGIDILRSEGRAFTGAPGVIVEIL